MFKKTIDTQAPIHDVIALRWSGCAYDPEKQPTPEQVLSLIEAARWAPSCFGDQPWRFIVFDKGRDQAAWQRAYECLAEGNQPWAGRAPLLFLASADSVMSKTGKPNRWGQYDTGAAALNLCLQATAMGLMAHQMGGFDADRARLEFKIPPQFTPMAMITVGYQLAEASIPDAMKAREYADRARNPLKHNFFSGNWDAPYS